MADRDCQMLDRTRWTKPMLQRLISLKQSGMAHRPILRTIQQEFGDHASPRWVGEINSEVRMLSEPPNPSLWHPAMEQRVKQYYAQGMDSKDMTTELFHEFAQPVRWQETYRKMQQMKLQGSMA